MKVLKNSKFTITMLGTVFIAFVLLVVGTFTVPSLKNLTDKFYVAVFGKNDNSDIYSVNNELYITLSGINQKIVLYEDGVIELYEDDTTLMFEHNYYNEPIAEPVTGKFSDGSSWSILGDSSLLLYEFKNHKFGITLIDNEIYLKNNKLEDVSLNANIPSFGFKGMEKFGTGRGFIWSRSLPVAFKSMIVGSGSDTFILVFPQNDLRGKLLYINNIFINVDKAHSIYLQYWINTGFLSLIGYLIILISTIIIAINSMLETGKDKNVHKLSLLSDNERFKVIMILGFICSIVGYSVSGLTADQNIVVSPLYWSIVGICISKWSRENKELDKK